MKNINTLLEKLSDDYSLNIKINHNYIKAFTHSSYINENKNLQKGQHYERLEFLGDAVLELATSQYLYDKFPHLSEGQLTKIRASVVCEASLNTYAKILEFDKFILLGKGEEKIGGRYRAALLADIFEAFIGALYLDVSINGVTQFLKQTLFSSIVDEYYHAFIDYKTILQEHISKEKLGNISYKLIFQDGPSHNKIFESAVLINETIYGQGQSKTKKESEQIAAKEALYKLNYFKENL